MMLPKKNKAANLEKKRAVHIQIGLIIALSFVLVSLEWGTIEYTNEEGIFFLPTIEADIDHVELIPRNELKEKIIPQLLTPVPVDENELADNIDYSDMFSSEDIGQGYVFNFPEDEPEERIVEPMDKNIIQIKPEFPGGDEAMMRWLYSNIKYPRECVEHGIEGKVIAKFTVSKFGKVTDIKIIRKVHPKLDAEVLRVLSEMPDFRPGMQNGYLMAVFMNIPVVFDLQ